MKMSRPTPGFDLTNMCTPATIYFVISLIGLIIIGLNNLDNNDKVKAFIVVHKTEGKIREYEIAYLGVHKEYRGLGYAKILLKKIIDKFKGSCLWLNALANNHIACNLYKEHGFKEMERIIDTSGNNAIIFATVECLS